VISCVDTISRNGKQTLQTRKRQVKICRFTAQTILYQLGQPAFSPAAGQVLRKSGTPQLDVWQNQHEEV
jgi:hypothetical protein